MPRSLRLLILIGLGGLLGLVVAYAGLSCVRSLRQERGIAAHAEEIFRSPTSFVAGNPEGDVSVVAFLDYNCPYCRRGAPDLAKLIEGDPKVRPVLKELPVLGKDSEDVARIGEGAEAGKKCLGERLGVAPWRSAEQDQLEQLVVRNGIGAGIAEASP